MNDIDQKVNSINDSVDYYWHSDTKRAISLVDEAYSQMDLLTDPTIKTETIANKGIAAYTLGEFEAAKRLYKRAIKLASLNNLSTAEYYGYYLIILQKQGQSSDVIDLSDSLIASGFDNENIFHIKGEALIELNRIEEFDRLLNQVNGQNDPKWFTLIAEKHRIVNEYDSAFKYLNKLTEITPFSELIEHAGIKKRMAQNYLMIGQFDKTLIELDSALKIYESSNFLYGKAEVIHELGNLYSELGNFEKSIEYYYVSRGIFEHLNSEKNVADSYLELGWMHFSIDNNKSKDLIYDAIAITKKINNRALLGKAYNYLGTYYSNIDKNDSAIYYYNHSIELKASIKDKRGVAAAKFNLASIYEGQGKIQYALNINKETLRIDPNDIVGIAIGNYTIGHLFTRLKNYDSARNYLYQAKSFFDQVKDSPYRSEFLLYLSEYHEQIGNADSALFYHKLYTENKIALSVAERKSRMAEMDVRFDLDQKNQEISLLNLENENRKQLIKIGEETISNQQFTIILITVIVLSLLIIGIVILVLYKNKSKANEKLEILMSELQEKTEEITAQSEELQEANEEIWSLNEGLENTVELRTKELKEAHQDLDTFFYRAAHDFKSPLTTFQGLTAIAHHTVKDKEALDLFRRMEDTFQRFALMINKLRDISTINVEEVKFQDVNLNKLFTKIEIDSQTVLVRNSIEFSYSNDIEQIYTNERIIHIIIDNLIENAIVFMGDKSNNRISVSVLEKEKFFEIKIEDNGIGIPENIADRVYDLYFRGSVLSKGNGLGLYICMKGVEKINASIDFESKPGIGTTFYVRIKKY
jgi:signal transduction histidine kinase/Tfp pilus assembly protein PilF